MSFWINGSFVFAVLNILQLVGWTAIMIYDGSLAAAGIFNIANWVWPVIIGGLIIIWILVGIENLGKINNGCNGSTGNSHMKTKNKNRV